MLSVASALSIQAHPDKRLAEKLHAERPHVYKDANHKPEMAVALSVFEALSGFVTAAELAEALTSVPELRVTVGEVVVVAFEAAAAAGERVTAAFKAAFTALMTAEASLVGEQVDALVARLTALQQVGRRAGRGWRASEGRW